MSLQRPSSRRQIAAVSVAFALAAGAGIVAVVMPTSAAPVGSPDALRRPALGPNLIENSGFGKGLTSWSQGPALDVARRGVLKSGWSAKLATPAASEAGAAVVLSDERSTAPQSEAGREYQASVFVRATEHPVRGQFRLTQWRASSVVEQDGEPFMAFADRWSRVTFTATAQGQGDRLVVSLSTSGLRGESSLKVDRVRLHPVKGSVSPSPSTSQTQTQTPAPEPSTSEPSTPAPDPTTSSPEPVQTQTQAPSGYGQGDTLFGASVQQGSRSWTDAVAASNAAYGGMEVVRVFYPGLPSKWPGRAGDVGGAVVVSFKAAPADVLSGKYDAYLTDWFKNAPRDRDIWWSYFHEPEDNVASGDFTAQQWRDAYRRIAGLAVAADNPRLYNTVILMCWTLSPASGRSFNDFFPGKDVVEALGWDCYAHSSSPYSSPQDMYGKALSTTQGLGLQFGIAETGARLGSDDPTGAKRADWLRTVGRWTLDNDAAFICYWDAAGTSGADYRLTDEPSKLAWREVTTTFGTHDPV